MARPQLGPLTVGALFGAGIGVLDAIPVLEAMRQGKISPDVGSVLLQPVAFAILGIVLGGVAEQLNRRASLAGNIWFHHFIRPLAFCAVPYLFIAASWSYFGSARLWGGFGFWFCVVIVPLLGFHTAWQRTTESARIP